MTLVVYICYKIYTISFQTNFYSAFTLVAWAQYSTVWYGTLLMCIYISKKPTGLYKSLTCTWSGESGKQLFLLGL